MGKIKFNPEFNLGNLLSAIVIAGTFIAMWAKWEGRVTKIEEAVVVNQKAVVEAGASIKQLNDNQYAIAVTQAKLVGILEGRGIKQ